MSQADEGNPARGEPTQSATPTESPTASPESCKPYRAPGDFLYEQGFDKSDFVSAWGSNINAVIDWQLALDRSVAYPMSQRPLRTQGAIQEFLDGPSRASTAARALIGDDVVVSGDMWVAVQFRVPISYSGNWYFRDKVLRGGYQRTSVGDVWWFNVNSSTCEVELRDSIRAICGNVGLRWIAPAIRRT